MRTPLATLALLLAACGSAEKEILGRWEFDPETFELVKTIREWPPEEKARRIAETRFDLTFTEKSIRWEQEMGYGWGTLSAEAPYTIASVDGKRVTIRTALRGVERESYVFSVDGDRLRFGVGGRSIILRRRR